MKNRTQMLAVLLALGTLTIPAWAQGHHKSFIVSTYVIQGTAQGLMNGNPDLAQSWATLTRTLKIDKIYIEVMRNHTLVDEAGLEKLKKFFQDQSVQVCGALGISPGGTTYPIVLSCDYSKGKFYILTIPSDPADLYALPSTALSVIRAALGPAEPIRIDSAPAQVALFRYDNNTFIVQNYLPTAAEVTVLVAGTATQLRNLLTGEDIAAAPAAGRGFGGFRGRGAAGPAPRVSFTFTVLPHSYMAFAVKGST